MYFCSCWQAVLRSMSKPVFSPQKPLNSKTDAGHCRVQRGLGGVHAGSQAVEAAAWGHQAKADWRHHQAESHSLHRQRRPAEESGWDYWPAGASLKNYLCDSSAPKFPWTPFAVPFRKTWVWCLQPPGRLCSVNKEKLTVFVWVTVCCR